MKASKVTAEDARLSYNRACDDYANGCITLDELMNAARQLTYAQAVEYKYQHDHKAGLPVRMSDLTESADQGCGCWNFSHLGHCTHTV
jgi:hypothetical protein